MLFRDTYKSSRVIEQNEQLPAGAELKEAPVSGKTLVIHPEDPTTDSLKAVYENIEAEVIRDTTDEDALFKKMQESDRVICLGHGVPYGLIGTGGRICVDHRHVELLRTKQNCVYVWCYATSFLEQHGLSGFASGMFISEEQEALYLGVPYTHVDEFEAGNLMFARSVGRSVAIGESAEETALRALNDYVGDTPVIKYNRALFASVKDGKKTMNEDILNATSV